MFSLTINSYIFLLRCSGVYLCEPSNRTAHTHNNKCTHIWLSVVYNSFILWFKYIINMINVLVLVCISFCIRKMTDDNFSFFIKFRDEHVCASCQWAKPMPNAPSVRLTNHYYVILCSFVPFWCLLQWFDMYVSFPFPLVHYFGLFICSFFPFGFVNGLLFGFSGN